MLTLSVPIARGGRAKVRTLLVSARLSTTAATLTAIVGTTSYFLSLPSGAGAARQPTPPPPPLLPPRPQPPALHRTACSRGYRDWALGLRMGDNNPLAASSAAIATSAADSVTSWDLTVRKKKFWCVCVL